MSSLHIYAHVYKGDRVEVRDSSTMTGATVTLGPEVVLFLCPEAVAGLESALVAYVKAKAEPPSATVLHMPQGRARRPQPEPPTNGAA